MIKVAEELYSSNDRQTEDSSTEIMNIKVTCVNTSQIKKALKGINRGKAGGANGLSIDLIKGVAVFY